MKPARTALAVLALAVLTLTGCSSRGATDDRTPLARPLTTAEADRAALARFSTYRRGTGDVTMTIPYRGSTVTLTGRVDWRRHLGYAELHSDTTPPARELIQWNASTVASRPQWTGGLPQLPPEDAWQAHRLTPHTSPIDAALLLLLGLGSDRPDNAQLLARSSARWIKEDHVGTTPVTLIAGPGTSGPGTDPNRPGNTRYWIDHEGGLLRFSARAGGETRWMTADLPRHGTAALPSPVPALGGS
ncbi:hypothetical protein ACFXB3_06215 [Streptomyces sp. NPDC059447]|uniref:hypothetical protein n=1 Tax=Streptomyces sp. NPDC059447 TaxID=3346834 RepID=UPI0036B9BFEC